MRAREAHKVIMRLSIALILVLAAASALVFSPGGRASAPAPEDARWTRVRSRNFTVVGQTGDREVRRIAARLELYRAAFARLLPVEHFNRQAETTVLLFRDDAAYRHFMPVMLGREAASVAGYFQTGEAVNYITLSLDAEHESSVLMHEFSHLLISNYFPHAPLWLKEGLSEYYSMARLSSDRRKLTLGLPPRAHARALRRRAPVAVRELVETDRDSPSYIDPVERSFFYAQSWAFVHYLQRDEAARARFAHFLELASEGATVADAFREAFEMEMSGAEDGFARYLRAGEFAARTEALGSPLEAETDFVSAPLSRAETLAQMGDLLLHIGRTERAEVYLGRALSLDENMASAHLSFGIMRLGQGRLAEAKEHLARAVSEDERNHLAHYYLAETLHREGLGMKPDDATVAGFNEKTRLIRSALRRSLELAPAFVESLRLLAIVELDRAGRPGEAAALVRRAQRIAPRRRDLVLILAHIHLNEKRFDEARRLAEDVARRGDRQTREQARQFLDKLSASEELHARIEKGESIAAQAPPVVPQPCDMPVPAPYEKRLRFSGAQACGRLSEVVCADSAVTLHVETDERTLRLRADSLGGVRFVTYTSTVRGQLTCGPRQPAETVLVTYRRKKDDGSGHDGEAVAVEFIPPDWNR